MGMIDQIIDFNKTSGTTRMEEYVPTLSRDCHDVPLLAKRDTATKRCLLLGVFIGISAFLHFAFAPILRRIFAEL